MEESTGGLNKKYILGMLGTVELFEQKEPEQKETSCTLLIMVKS